MSRIQIGDKRVDWTGIKVEGIPGNDPEGPFVGYVLKGKDKELELKFDNRLDGQPRGVNELVLLMILKDRLKRSPGSRQIQLAGQSLEEALDVLSQFYRQRLEIAERQVERLESG